ncbi:MAG: alpha-amylase family glycosyl hydrolase, partial [Bacteroidales bacterium]
MKSIRLCRLTSFLLALSVTGLSAQVIESDPLYPTVNDPVDITFYPDQCDCDLKDHTGDIYAHTGLITSESSDQGDWKFVVAEWDENTEKAKLEKINSTTYVLHITPDLKTYYEIPDGTGVEQLAFVFRNPDGTQQTSNIYYDVYDPGLSVSLTEPSGDLVVKLTDTIDIFAEAIMLGTSDPDSITLYIDDAISHISYEDTLRYEFIVSTAELHWIKVIADNGTFHVADSAFFFVRDDLTVADLPAGAVDGINYIDTSTVTVVLHAPYKDNVLLIGDFNDWQLDNDYLMNRTPDEERYWLTLSNLTKGEEYAFQYLVDGNIRIADPYTDKILDPDNDESIPESSYPDLKPYPKGKTTQIVSVFQTAQDTFRWEVEQFVPVSVTDLVIYELHIRDFVENSNFKTVTDTLDYLEELGINAVELMPVSEFEGNDSWGYNPSFYFAVDKYYGTKNDFKLFVDECHKRGMAVLMDLVLNHSYGQSPMVRLYFDPQAGEYGQPTPESPWYNEECPHEPWCWGYDFNHESAATKTFVTRVNRYWMEEYKIDGYRFDFTKGFTNTIGDGWEYDASRISILKAMYDSIKAVNENALVIFEHLSENTEETELANYGILLWGKMTDPYNEATMGYHDGSKSDLSGISYLSRSWDMPHLVGYMESHDEQRLMYKNQTWGNSSGNYDVKGLNTGLARMEAAATFFFTVPGPKMVWQFGELGYDVDIDEPCRVCRKPIRWEYFDHANRYRLYQVFSALIRLRTEEDLFETTDFSLDVSSALKKMHLNSSSMNAAI